MNRFRVIRITSEGKLENVPASEFDTCNLSDNLQKHYDSIEKHGVFIRDTLYKIHNATHFYSYPLSFFMESQQYSVEGGKNIFKIVKGLQRYEQHDMSFIPPLSLFVEDCSKDTNTLQYVESIKNLLWQRIPLFTWFRYLPLMLQVLLLNDAYSQYTAYKAKVKTKGHYLFKVLSDICMDTTPYSAIAFKKRRTFHEYRYRLFQKNNDVYYLVFTIFTPFVEFAVPSFDDYTNMVALKMYNHNLYNQYREYRDKVTPYIKVTDVFRRDFPEFKVLRGIMELNPLMVASPATFKFKQPTNAVIKNPLTKK